MRLDKYLYENSLARSRTHAAELIKNGKVQCDGEVVSKPSYDVPDDAEILIVGDEVQYVSRGALKLEYALDHFGIDPNGMHCVDVGASTGGFTDVLLRRGASRVYAIDSGHGQLAESIAADSRVVSIEGFNARELSVEAIGELVTMCVCDVSFISQTLLHAPIFSVLADGGKFVALVKPQFELTRCELSKNGIVRNRSFRLAAAKRVYLSLIENGFTPRAFTVSPITGGDGNTEYLIFAEKCGNDQSMLTIEQIERIISDEDRDSTAKGQQNSR